MSYNDDLNAHWFGGKPKPVPPLRLTGKDLAIRNNRIDKRDGQRCARCGVIIWSGGSRHHRKFKSRRGGDEVSNGVLLCGSGTTGCHGWVHSNPVSARMVGLALNTNDNPRLVPVRHAAFGGMDVWLDDLGNVSLTPPRLAA
ncbi:hypothetical protein QN355_06425 [Cryobacterium sp. 10S3]|uniref:HNH endonuclease n=1 Tax=Cryobacterium sp. 10S3 TaxID=3048582 RepID=UPI002AC90431|nr:hypothetical protein [Cryobacterium sp. 10S3]MEB0286184.1 hypothetical protein [Cryobacterium sp. 10S3]WPX12242.1 hypothetical protein RHM57_11165 [Cryobacterium sp. 10S3]